MKYVTGRDLRLDSDALSLLELASSRITHAVVDVDSDEVPQVMWEEGEHGLARYSMSVLSQGISELVVHAYVA